MEIEKQFGQLSEFNGRNAKLYRSSNQRETAFYFAMEQDMNLETASAFFEVLRFELTGGDHQLYVRFPGENHFVEMYGGGSGSGRGDMLSSHGDNVWRMDKNHSPITIYSHGDDLIVLFGRTDWTPSFNFMKKVASYDKGNPYCTPYPDITSVNPEELSAALSMQYLKLPESIRCISYCYKTEDQEPVYLLVDCPAYNLKYENHRMFVIFKDDAKEHKITSFVRLRDGGTTIITFVDELGNQHEFFSPTTMPEKVLHERWNKIRVIEASEEEQQHLVELLSLHLEPEEDEDD